MEADIDWQRLFAGLPTVAQCSRPDHAKGARGCTPTMSDAVWSFKQIHFIPGRLPLVEFLCVGAALWIRGRMSSTMTCTGCGLVGPLEQFYMLYPIEKINH